MRLEILVAMAVGFIPYLVNGVLWLVNSEKKKYAAQRDFEHLKANQKEISNGIAHFAEEMEEYFEVLNRDILEIKIRLNIETTKIKIRKNIDDDSE